MYLRVFRIGIIVAVIFISATAFAQNQYAYNEAGVAVNLTMQDSLITAKLAGPLQSWDDVFFAEIALDPSVVPEPIADDFVRLRVKSGYDPMSLVQRLRQRNDILFANNSFFDPNGNPIYLTETFVANFVVGTTRAQIDSMNHAHGVVIDDSLFNDLYWLLLKLTANSDNDVLTMGNLYHESPLVHYAKAGMILKLQAYAEPDDPYWQYQWQFQNTGQYGGTPGADIHLVEALNYAVSPSASLIVAVLDNGFAPHEDFPISRFAGGYDYYNGKSDYKPDSADCHGMGTMGIIAATTGNGVGIAGISNNVRILGQKIFERNRFVVDAKLAQAFSDAVLAGARVISCSWGCVGCDDSWYPGTAWWIHRADSAGVSIVAASGNVAGWGVAWPASDPEVIAVGASDNNDQRLYYSQYGAELDVVAPSSGGGSPVHFWTLDQMGDIGCNDGSMDCDVADGNYHCTFGGTSAACPEVAGIVALLLLHQPDLVGHTEEIREIIRYSADRTPYGSAPGDTARVNDYVGWGRVNAARALAMTCTCGDADGSAMVNLSDVVALIGYVFNGIPVPGYCNYANGLGDADGDGIVNLSDAVTLIGYVFNGTPVPHCNGVPSLMATPSIKPPDKELSGF